MRVLVACEFSGIVRDAFLAVGHEAMSCDLDPSERPGAHYRGSVLDILDRDWDMMIAFPPCTYLSKAGARFWKKPAVRLKQIEAFSFVQLLACQPIPMIAIENPAGYLSTHWRKPDQIIHPFMFGHPVMKGTCLWLKNLPPLIATCIHTAPMRDWVTQARFPRGDNDRQKARSRTFSGIAAAMAQQWG